MYASHLQTSASRNTALGYSALYANQNGADNVGIGSNALSYLSLGGTQNVGV